MEAVLKDKRFAHVANDQRFRRMPYGERKVKIDKRFKAMFKDKRFKLKYSVDKRGKPTNTSSNENLKKYYELDSDSSEDEEEADEDRVADPSDEEGEASDTNKADTDSSSDTSETVVETKSKHGKKSDSALKGKDKDTQEDAKKGKKQTKQKPIQPSLSISEKKHGKGKKVKKEEDDSEEEEEDGSGPETDQGDIKAALQSGIDIARGVGNIESSSSEDEDDDEEEEDKKQKSKGKVHLGDGIDNNDDESSSEEEEEEENLEDIDHRWGEIDENVIEMEAATRRLAVCNMDWDRIKPRDIFVLLNSFKSSKGIIKNVKIYASEYGKERMAEEQAHGPRELKELKKVEDEENDDDTVDKDGSAYNTEKLRQYQLNRLKYYYAVAECDSEETADNIYKECDGMEYESSCNKLDLRFIPDDTEFDDEPVSQCTETPVNYEPMFFTNAALSQSKVDLTWDETDVDRVALTQKQFEGKPTDVENDDINAYLASSSDEEAPDYEALIGNQSDEGDEDKEVVGRGVGSEEKQIDQYRKLLQDIDSEQTKKRDEDVQMEITWEVGLKSTTKNILKKKSAKDSTPWEEYLQKKKEKKKKKREDKKKEAHSENEEEEEQVEEGPEGGQAFSDDELPAGVDPNDPFFAQDSEDAGNKKKGKKKKKKQKMKTEEETEEDLKEKEALSLLTMDEESDKKHFNMKKIVEGDGKKKKKKKKGDKNAVKKENKDGFEFNVEDPRFSAVYKSHLYNIDPSAPEYKKTTGTDAIIEQKLKKRAENDKGNSKRQHEDKSGNTEFKKQKTDNDSLASLVNSVKTKTKQFQNKKNRK